MVEILTSAQMRAVEVGAIDSGRVTGLELMERAGAGVVAAITAQWPEAERRAVVLCGPGNNGGDGYVIARLLHARGWQVRLWAPTSAMTPDAAANAVRWAEIGPTLSELEPTDLTGAIVVDALFGTGLGRPVGAPFIDALAMAQKSGARLVAVDILSGLCADTGRIRTEGAALPRGADLTVTFQAAKRGHYLLPAGGLTGALHVVDIGLGAELAALSGEDVALAPSNPMAARLHKGAGHKFSHGHALVLAGGVGRGGAARLAARSALRAGAGLVTLACPPAALIENAARLDAVMLRPLRDAAALPALLKEMRISTICLGPGLGFGAREASLLDATLRSGLPLVLDADALTLIAQDAGLRTLLHPDCVLTPHEGEFRRLWPALAADTSLSKCDRAVKAARDAGAVVLLKGADTVIAAPEGGPVIHAALGERAAPELATAGSGDVLAGLIAGLMARGLPPAEVAATGAWLHVEAARQIGPGLIAEDLPEALPAVLRALR